MINAKQKSRNKKWIFFSALLIAYVFLIEIFFVLNEPWVSDYWEHRAVLNELVRNIANPTHPIINSETPHAFFSPYMVGLAAFARIFSMNSLTALNIAALLNLSLFFFAVWLLSHLFFKKYGVIKSFFFISLIFLFYWGVLPPYFSSFYHFVSLPYTAPYPSTFSFGCSVISAFIFEGLIRTKSSILISVLKVVLILWLNWVVFITHPHTFFFTVSMFFFLVSRNLFRQGAVRVLVWLTCFFITGLLFLIPVGASLAWKYYPMLDLIGGVVPANKFHTESIVLYQNMVQSYFPLLIPAGFLMYGVLKKRKEDIVWCLPVFFLLTLYLYGLFTNQYAFGRAIAFLAMWLQIYLLVQLMRLKLRNFYRWIAVSTVVVFSSAFFFFSNKVIFTTALNGVNFSINRKPAVNISHQLRFLQYRLEKGEVVLADTETSRYIPAFGGKIVFTPFPDYWVKDNGERVNDVHLFFEPSTNKAERLFLIQKYKPSYLLLTPQNKFLISELREKIDLSASISEGDFWLVKIR